MTTIASPTPQRHSELSKSTESLQATHSASSSAYLHDSSLSDVDSELSNYDFASDDDEAGVFFGAHNPIERRIVASLSRSIPPSPASGSLAALADGPRRSSLNSRVRVRESREFLRRKTLMSGELELNTSGEKEGSSFLAHTEEPEAGPSSRPFDSRAREDTPEEDMPSFHIDEGMFLPEPSDDEDKENTMIPEPYYESEEEVPSPGERLGDKPVTLGFGGVGLDDVSAEIDMGGLTLLDLDDPDLGPLEDTSIAFDSLGDDTGSDLSSSRSTQTTDDNPFLGNSTSSAPSIVMENPFVTVMQTTPAGPDVPQAVSSAERSPHPRELALPHELATPLKYLARELFPQTPSDVVGNTSYDSELDSPIVARGPFVIPAFSVASPHATPLRGLEPGPSRTDLPPNMTPSMAMSLPALDSPTLPAVTPRRCPPSLAPLPKTPASALKNRTPPSRLAASHVPGSLRPNRVFTSSQVEATADEEKARRRALKAEMRAKQLAATIRGQLDYIVSSKMTSFEGVSPVKPGSPVKPSASPAKSPLRLAEAQNRIKSPAKLQDRKPAPMSGIPLPKPLKASTGIPRPGIPRPVTKPIKSALKRPQAPASAAAPASVQRSQAPPSVQRPPPPPIQRSHIAPPSVQKTHVAPGSVQRPHKSVAILEPLSATINARPEAAPVSLKRPFSAIQPMERSAVAVGTAVRSSLGLPVRPVREPMREMGQGQFSIGSAHFGSTGSVLPSPRGSLMGKPVRLTGMTPQRTTIAATPSRVGTTPLKQPPFRPAPSSGSANRITPLVHPIPRPAVPAPLMPRLSEARSEPADEERDVAMDEATPKEPADEKMDIEEPAPEAAPESEESGASEPNGADGDSGDARQENQEPASPTPTRRSSRTTRPPPVRTPAPAKKATTPPASIVPGMSDRELRTATARNTLRNQVYLCAIDRQIVRVPGPRPPSPTSKIPKTADREEEIKKAEREARAKRRHREDADDGPAVEEVHLTTAPGDEGPYAPNKRQKTEDGRNVRWNGALTVIRGGLGEAAPGSASGSVKEEALRSCLKPDAQVPLDAHGNALDRPVEKLKRAKVTVRAVFYDGEDPVPFSYAASNTRSKKKGKKEE